MPYPLGEIESAINRLGATLLLLAPLALVIAGIGGFLLTGRALKPVENITEAAGRIGADAIDERLPEHGDDEFTRLSSTFNAMLDRLAAGYDARQTLIEQLQEIVEQQRRFTADASHELRTPLTAIRANSSLSLSGETDGPDLRQAMKEIDSAAVAMAQLIDDLLLLARADAGKLTREKSEILLSELIVDAISISSRRDRANIQLQMKDPTLVIFGSKDELVRLVGNLLENALKHTPSDGTVTVTAASSSDTITMVIKDSGCGIAADHVCHLGERFYRVDESRTRTDGGTGLGLAICKSIAASHGGHLEIESALGIGTTVTVVLPRAGETTEPPDAPKM